MIPDGVFPTGRESLAPPIDGCHYGARRPSIERVAIVISELRAGGAERVVVHLAGALKRMGVHPTVICLQNKGPLAVLLESNGIPVHALESMRGYDVPAIGRCTGILRRIGPSVINVHDRSSLPYAVLANRAAGHRPVVFSCHGLLVQAHSAPRLIARAAMRDVQVVTAVSDATAQEYSLLLDWSKDVRIIPNGVPLASPASSQRQMLRAELGLTDGHFVFLAVGNVKPEKAFDILIRAAYLLRNRTGAHRFAVLVVGNTANEAYAPLEEARTRLGLQGTLSFLGYREDTYALYAAADAFVLPSRKEGLPMVLLEAMAAGLPVVATRVGGVPDVIQHGATGLLVTPESPDELADSMSTLMHDTSLRAEIGMRGQQRIRQNFSIEHMARGYLEAYSQATVGWSGGTPGRRPRLPLKPRVLMLGPLPPLTGGMATVAENLLRSTLSRSCQLAAVNTGKTTPEGRTLLTGIRAQIALAARIMAHLLLQRPHLVHVHTSQFFGFWRDCVHLLLARAMGCRTVLHNHGASFDTWANGMGPLRLGLVRWAFETASSVVVLSPKWQRKLCQYAPRANWRVIPNGLPMPARVNDVTTAAEPVFLFLGDWTPRKGVRDLVAATEVARRRGFRGAVRLAGFEKASGQLTTLREHIHEAGCEAIIEVLGTLSIDEKDRALALADCLVLPSYAEGLPMAVLEAMSHGIPVIATGVGAIPEVITDGREGFLIDPGDVQALADRMLKLFTDPDLRIRMGRAARRRVEEEYSLDAMVGRTMSVYSEVLGRELWES